MVTHFIISYSPHVFQDPSFSGSGFSKSWFYRIQVFQGPGYLKPSFFRVQVSQNPGISESTVFRVLVQVLEVALVVVIIFKK